MVLQMWSKQKQECTKWTSSLVHLVLKFLELFDPADIYEVSQKRLSSSINIPLKTHRDQRKASAVWDTVLYNAHKPNYCFKLYYVYLYVHAVNAKLQIHVICGYYWVVVFSDAVSLSEIFINKRPIDWLKESVSGCDRAPCRPLCVSLSLWRTVTHNI